MNMGCIKTPVSHGAPHLFGLLSLQMLSAKMLNTSGSKGWGMLPGSGGGGQAARRFGDRRVREVSRTAPQIKRHKQPRCDDNAWRADTPGGGRFVGTNVKATRGSFNSGISKNESLCQCANMPMELGGRFDTEGGVSYRELLLFCARHAGKWNDAKPELAEKLREALRSQVGRDTCVSKMNSFAVTVAPTQLCLQR